MTDKLDFTSELYEQWMNAGPIRFGQFIINCAGEEDLLYISDESLLASIKKKYGEGS